MICTSQTLTALFAEQVEPQLLAEGKRAQAAVLRRAVHVFAEFNGRDVTLCEATEQRIDEFSRWLKREKFATNTRRHFFYGIRGIVRRFNSEAMPSRQGDNRHDPLVERTPRCGSMYLSRFIDEYASGRDVSENYVNQLKWFGSALAKTHGKVVRTSDLTPRLINAHLQNCRERGLSDETRRSRRRMFLTLAEAAIDAGLADEFSRRKVMKIKRPGRVIRTWTPQEVAKLLAAAEAMRGYHQDGVRRCDYWTPYVRFAWDTGLRGVDIRRLTREDVEHDGAFRESFVIVQHKTGKRIRLHLRESTREAMGHLPRHLWQLWGRIENWRREAEQLVQAAGLSGGIGRLRHSSGTAVETIARGRGHEHLGNTRQVFELHYLDIDRLPDDRPLPPALEGGSA